MSGRGRSGGWSLAQAGGERGKWGQLLLTALVLVLVMILVACESHEVVETRLFEEAEMRLRIGDYDGARLLYERFLREHPQSPLRNVAEARHRGIARELDSVMGRRGAPAPVLVPAPGGLVPEEELRAPPVEVQAPELPVFDP